MALHKNQENHNNVDYNSDPMGNHDTAALLPHLESFEKMLQMPVVKAAWDQSQDVYGRVKGTWGFFFPSREIFEPVGDIFPAWTGDIQVVESFFFLRRSS